MNAALVLRAAAAVCLAGVVMGIPERSPFVPPRAVLVLDDSASVRRSLPGFSAEAAGLWKGFQGGGRPVIGVGSQAPGITDIPSALRLAAALGPPNVETRILLATDGVSREAGLDETLRLLRERGARVFGLIPPQAAPLARVVEIVLPERVFLWEPFPVRGRIMASQPGPVAVQLSRNGEIAAEDTVTVDAGGSAIVEFTQEGDRVGRLGFALGISGSGFPPAAGEVSVAQSPRVQWLSEDVAAAGPLVGLLRNAGVEVELHHPADLLAPEPDLAQADVIVLDDIPPAALTDALAAALARRVGEQGAGLAVFGGRKGLGSGEYAGSGVEALLPVVAGFRTPPPPPSVAMVLALDSSFSMAYRGRGEASAHGTDPRKIDVAKESAKAVVRIVRRGDRLGILGNSTDIFWIAPLGEITDPAAVIERIEQVKPAGDGIYFYSMLYEAREALRREQGGVRHVLVLCDAEDIDQYEIAGRGHSYDLLREMAREGITVSILAIGRPTDKDVPFLRTAALLGRGDFYLVPRIVALPRYFVSEYQRISSARHFLEEQIRAVASEPAALGLLATGGAFPTLEGLALVTAREGSRTLLQSDFGAPLLVGGTYGRGRTTVFAGDNGYRWASRWVGAEALRRFWLQLIFSVAPHEERARGFASFLAAERATNRLLFNYAGSDGALPSWDALWLLPVGGTGEPLRLDRVGLRAYRGALPPGAEHFRRVRIAADRQGEKPLLTTGYSLPPAGEDLPLAPRAGFVGRLIKETGGGWVNRPEEMIAPAAARDRLPLPAAVLLIAAGVSLLLAEVVVRTFKEG